MALTPKESKLLSRLVCPICSLPFRRVFFFAFHFLLEVDCHKPLADWLTVYIDVLLTV